jgi:hypothetical protein
LIPKKCWRVDKRDGHSLFVAPASRRRFLNQATYCKIAGETPAPQNTRATTPVVSIPSA